MTQNQTEQFQLIYGYKDNNILRHSFNNLAQMVFGINFESLYQSGSWNDRYDCYSYIGKGNIISNVSVNKLDMIINRKKVKALQIGTVMTHPEYRGKGLAGKLMNYVLEKYENEYEVIYLFANKDVLDFYPKYGFKSLKQSQYIFDVKGKLNKGNRILKLDIMKDDDVKLIQKLANERKPVSRVFGIANAYHLLMFYCLYVFNECIYYIDNLDTIVIYKIDNGDIHIYDIISKKQLDFTDFISRIATGKEQKVVFHFTPDFDDIESERISYDDSDDMFFVRSKTVNIPENLFHPITAHA